MGNGRQHTRVRAEQALLPRVHGERRPLLALVLVTLCLAACAPGATHGAVVATAALPTPSRLPAATALVLRQPYRDFGITLVVTRYDRQVDPSTIICASSTACVAPGERFIRLDYMMTNTFDAAQRVVVRFATTPESGVPGVNEDGPPTILDGIPYFDTSGAFQRDDQLRPGVTAAHVAYYGVFPPQLRAIGVYLCLPDGSSCIRNTPVLFLVQISA